MNVNACLHMSKWNNEITKREFMLSKGNHHDKKDYVNSIKHSLRIRWNCRSLSGAFTIYVNKERNFNILVFLSFPETDLTRRIWFFSHFVWLLKPPAFVDYYFMPTMYILAISGVTWYYLRMYRHALFLEYLLMHYL